MTDQDQTASFVLRVPVELKLNIFSHVSAAQVARLRHVCKRFRNTIDTNEETLAKSIIARETGRFERYRAGLDFEDVPFLDALKRWVERRGIWIDSIGPHVNAFLTWYKESKYPERSAPRQGNMSWYTLNLLRLHLKLRDWDKFDRSDRRSIGNDTIDRITNDIRKDAHYPESAWFLNESRLDDNLSKLQADAAVFGTPTIIGEKGSLVQREDNTWHFGCPTEYMVSKGPQLHFKNLTRLNITNWYRADMIDEESISSALGIPALPKCDGRPHFSYCVNEDETDERFCNVI